MRLGTPSAVGRPTQVIVIALSIITIIACSELTDAGERSAPDTTSPADTTDQLPQSVPSEFPSATTKGEGFQPTPSAPPSANTGATYNLYEVREESITKIMVEHAGEQVGYARIPETGAWVIQGESNIPVYVPDWAGTLLLISNLRGAELLYPTEPPDQPTLGLDPPESVLVINIIEMQPIRVLLGHPAPGGNQIFASVDEKAYLVSAVWADAIRRLATNPPDGPR